MADSVLSDKQSMRPTGCLSFLPARNILRISDGKPKMENQGNTKENPKRNPDLFNHLARKFS